MTDESSPPDVPTARDAADQRTAVRERYGRLATGSQSCCSSETSGTTRTRGTAGTPSNDGSAGISGRSCADQSCTPVAPDTDQDHDDRIAGAELQLGCGNPIAIAGLETGEVVLDLGAGGGFDCFLAAREVGPEGHVIGVDMTPEMVETARENALENDLENVDVRLGEIEHLPVADGTVDVILSNCVINLSPDKHQVFREAFRVLRPGGRLAISDVVMTAELPADIRTDPTVVAACIGGAASIPALRELLTSAGFTAISIEPQRESAAFIREWDAERDLSEYLVSARIEATKPDPND